MSHLPRRAILAGLALAPLARANAAPQPLSPSRFLRGDVLAALQQCAERAVQQGATMWIDRDYAFRGVWRPPSGLVVRGPFSNSARLIAPDGVEITGAIDLDGLVVDGGRVGGDRTTGASRALVAIHGPLGQGVSKYLPGVRVGRLRVRRTQGVGLVLANLDGPTFGAIEIEDVYCHGSIWSGLRQARLDRLTCRNAGDLLPSMSRRGAGMLIATETKVTAPWYTPDTARAMLPTEGFKIGAVEIDKVTDTAFYSHDDFRTGVRGVSAEAVTVRTAGKDGVKFRAGPSQIQLGDVRVQGVAGTGVSLDGVAGVRIRTLQVRGFGLDTVGQILGRPAVFRGQGGPGQSLSDAPVGLSIDGARDIGVERFEIADGHFSPDRHYEGHGLRVYASRGVRTAGTVRDVDGNAVRICGASDFDIDVEAIDAGGGNYRAAVLIGADRGPSSNGRLRIRNQDGRRGSTTGFRVADDSRDITATLVGDVSTKIARKAAVALRRP